MIERLKECPHCGGECEIGRRYPYGNDPYAPPYFAGQCKGDCSNAFREPAEAVAAWNRRVESAEVAGAHKLLDLYGYVRDAEDSAGDALEQRIQMVADAENHARRERDEALEKAAKVAAEVAGLKAQLDDAAKERMRLIHATQAERDAGIARTRSAIKQRDQLFNLWTDVTTAMVEFFGRVTIPPKPDLPVEMPTRVVVDLLNRLNEARSAAFDIFAGLAPAADAPATTGAGGQDTAKGGGE